MSLQLVPQSTHTSEEESQIWEEWEKDPFPNDGREYPLPPRNCKVPIRFNPVKFEWEPIDRKQTIKKTEKTKYVWLTINPKPEFWTQQQFSRVLKVMSSMVKNKPFEASIYCIEQESTDSTYTHPHIHCLISRNGSPCRLREMIKKTFVPYVGNVDDQHHLKIVDNISVDQCSVKLSYMKGHKKGSNKSGIPKVDIAKNDIPFRQAWGLEPLYGEVAF